VSAFKVARGVERKVANISLINRTGGTGTAEGETSI
jgi:hypothetical protein